MSTKLKYLIIITVLGLLVFVVGANMFMARNDAQKVEDKENNPVPIEQNTNVGEKTSDTSGAVDQTSDGADKTEELQACLIGVLGPDRILKLQSGELTITPAIQAKIEECTGKVGNL